jgi:hypothetical protein
VYQNLWRAALVPVIPLVPRGGQRGRQSGHPAFPWARQTRPTKRSEQPAAGWNSSRQCPTAPRVGPGDPPYALSHVHHICYSPRRPLRPLLSDSAPPRETSCTCWPWFVSGQARTYRAGLRAWPAKRGGSAALDQPYVLNLGTRDCYSDCPAHFFLSALSAPPREASSPGGASDRLVY